MTLRSMKRKFGFTCRPFETPYDQWSAVPVPPAAFWKPWQRYYVVHKVSRSTVSQPAARKPTAVREAISCGPGIKCKIAHSTARGVALCIHEVSTNHVGKNKTCCFACGKGVIHCKTHDVALKSVRCKWISRTGCDLATLSKQARISIFRIFYSRDVSMQSKNYSSSALSICFCFKISMF